MPDCEQDEPRDDVNGLPDPERAHADEHLRVLRLRERVVERPLLDVFHQLHHVRLDERPDHSAEEDLDAEEAQELRLCPTVQRRRVRVDEREHDEARHHLDERLEQAHEEVHAVLELVQHTDLEKEPGDSQRAHRYPPTAEKRLIAERQAMRKSPSPAPIQNTCTNNPPTSCRFEKSPARHSIG